MPLRKVRCRTSTLTINNWRERAAVSTPSANPAYEEELGLIRLEWAAENQFP